MPMVNYCFHRQLIFAMLYTGNVILYNVCECFTYVVIIISKIVDLSVIYVVRFQVCNHLAAFVVYVNTNSSISILQCNMERL